MEVNTSRTLPAPYVFGLTLLCFALIARCYSAFPPAGTNSDGVFIITHLITLLYFFSCWIGGFLKPWEGRRKVMSVFVVLLLTDAYTVNESIRVFESSSTWSAVMLIFICANILAFGFFERWPEWVKYLQCAVLGFTLLLPFYLAFYLLPVYLVSLIGLLAIGLSIVTFSPIFLLWFNFRMVRKLVWPVRSYRLTYLWSGAVAALAVVLYMAAYANDKSKMEHAYTKSNIAVTEELPPWISAAQEAGTGFITAQLLKTDIVYTSPGVQSGFNLWDMPDREFGERRTHDPLFMTAGAFLGTITIPEEDRLKMLNVMFDKRHYTVDRYWTGKDLVTTGVSTTANIWPQYHLAYTENIYTVKNIPKRRWSSSEEAIYTFHLPEGAVVTSLSLWINNHEEKAILTTQAKATEAYSEIVGRQQRDPSVVHWQEGNRVVVRVFPVLQNEERKFKIGITSPLKVQHGKLVYQPVWFEGPAHEDAHYEVKLNMDKWPGELSYPGGFYSDKGKTVGKTGKYDADWELTMRNEATDNAAFSFNGQRYTLLPYQPSYELFVPENYYLDVNNSWSYDDYREIISQLNNKKVWIFHPRKGMMAVKEDNKQSLFNELHDQRFSLFPFYKITNPATALVISASDNISPQLSDLDTSAFRNNLRRFLSHEKIRLYNISNTLSPYLATLKESRSLVYENGTKDQLLAQLRNNSFLRQEEDSNQLIMEDAQIRIARSMDNTQTEGPDHLARLFAYNSILKELGPKVTGEDLSSDTALINAAKAAYVVTPLSSLIVLETQADYDKFKISDDVNSLKNASLKGHGAVPEPHEWALFIIAVAILAYVRFEKLFKRKRSVC
ncbi:XrtN system VIT domain protein [Chitinophaga ginsengisegetis]|uniref:XrtN system VIT domain protein n=1 Tax=Chitinophaga ginsengisegetis TaxID=393003 RepID=A0A1T5NA05_9BACT|nr:XrtN system VIT domain-containing protein [Chitinophaga ginsengisegetis]SKC97307.1 XrtN system VIT domain protein [Chitinophaga ginsengisegetis]